MKRNFYLFLAAGINLACYDLGVKGRIVGTLLVTDTIAGELTLGVGTAAASLPAEVGAGCYTREIINAALVPGGGVGISTGFIPAEVQLGKNSRIFLSATASSTGSSAVVTVQTS